MDNTKHTEKVVKKENIYIYWFKDNTYYHLHYITNVSALSHLMDKGLTWAATIIDPGGFYPL